MFGGAQRRNECMRNRSDVEVDGSLFTLFGPLEVRLIE